MNTGDRSAAVNTLTEDIRKIYKSDSARAAVLIESYLAEKLRNFTADERMKAIETLTHKFDAPETHTGVRGQGTGRKEVSQVITRLLGKEVPVMDLSPDELMKKLSNSLNTVFDSLNQIISVINTTLLGKRVELETIRHIIGSGLENGGEQDSLQDYLDQIQEAFLVAHRAFQEAASGKIKQILNELDPERIAESTEKSLKFGALRKAEYFDVYTEKYEVFMKWFESGRAAEELLREFEKICQKLYKNKARSVS